MKNVYQPFIQLYIIMIIMHIFFKKYRKTETAHIFGILNLVYTACQMTL